MLTRTFLAISTNSQLEQNKKEKFEKDCVVDSISRNEAPMTWQMCTPVHNTGKDFIDKWLGVSDKLVVYRDYGFNREVRDLIKKADKMQLPVEFRLLNDPNRDDKPEPSCKLKIDGSDDSFDVVDITLNMKPFDDEQFPKIERDSSVPRNFFTKDIKPDDTLYFDGMGDVKVKHLLEGGWTHEQIEKLWIEQNEKV